MPNYFVYIVTNPAKTVLYTGMTNDLERRIIEHFRNRGNNKTFAGRYYCYNLVCYERFHSSSHAIEREKEIKDWNRSKKETLISEFNPSWGALNGSIMQWPPPPEVMSNY
ncbi:MAG: GIY-YIG nuclease family protein [Reichenbachiella sp.]|uniref:GIY-YIG nuclease family protein n=1 Tax=Reichenbachiella sp. TaxID=2184521 RepID=UPI00326448CD